eukprot:4126808-Amphidinium_carterae.2
MCIIVGHHLGEGSFEVPVEEPLGSAVVLLIARSVCPPLVLLARFEQHPCSATQPSLPQVG